MQECVTEAGSSPSGGRQQFVITQLSNGVLTARPVGPSLGRREALIIADEIRTLLDAHAGEVRFLVLDLSDVALLSSMGVGMCIDLRNHAKRSGAETILFGLRKEMAELFRMMRLDRLFRVAASTDQLQRLAA